MILIVAGIYRFNYSGSLLLHSLLHLFCFFRLRCDLWRFFFFLFIFSRFFFFLFTFSRFFFLLFILNYYLTVSYFSILYLLFYNIIYSFTFFLLFLPTRCIFQLSLLCLFRRPRWKFTWFTFRSSPLKNNHRCKCIIFTKFTAQQYNYLALHEALHLAKESWKLSLAFFV